MRKNIIFVLVVILSCNAVFSQSLEWAKSFSGGGSSLSNSVAVDKEGNVYTTGPLRGAIDFDPGPGVFELSSSRGFGGSDIFISKLDRFGNFKWARQYSAGYSSRDESSGEAIAVDSTGNVYVGGNFNAQMYFNNGVTSEFIQSGRGISKDFFISKLSKDGSLIWTKGFGGDYYDILTSLTVDNSGNVYSTGIYSNGAAFGAVGGLSVAGVDNNSDIFILKQDTNGNSQWVKRIGGTRSDWANSITVDKIGNVYATGNIVGNGMFDSQTGVFNVTDPGFGNISNNIYVSKMDANGNFIWVKSTTGNYDIQGKSVKVDNIGNVIIAGIYFNTNDFDPGANTVNLTPVGQYDFFIEKLDSLGNFKWVKSIGSTGADFANGIAIDESNNIYTTGRFQSIVDFDPGNGVSNLTSTSPTDCYISKLDSSGNYVWAKRIGGTSDCIGNSIFVDLNKSIYTTGYFEGQVDFDPDYGVFNLTTSSASTSNVFVLKMAQCNIPVLNNLPNQTICNNSLTTPVNFTSTPTNTSTIYSWTNNNSQIGLVTNGIGNIPAFTALNNTSNPIISTITVVPTVKTSKNAYIPNFNSNTVSVIDLSTNNIVTTIAVGSQPTGVAITPDGLKVYITNQFSNNISVISTINNSVIATLSVGSTPTGIVVTPNGNKIYVSINGGNQIAEVNPLTNTVVSYFDCHGTRPYNLTLTPDGTRLYVACRTSDNVSVFNTNDNSFVTTIAVGARPWGIKVKPSGNFIYVTSQNSNNISVINTSTNLVSSTINVGGMPSSICFSPDGSKLYVAHQSNDLYVINTTSNSVTNTIPVGGYSTGISINADGSLIYVSNTTNNVVNVISTSNNSILQSIIVGSFPISLGDFIYSREACIGNSVSFTYTINPSISFTTSVITGTRNINRCDTLQNYSVLPMSGVTFAWSVTGTGNYVKTGKGTNAVVLVMKVAGTISVKATNFCGVVSAATTLAVTKAKPTTAGIIYQRFVPTIVAANANACLFTQSAFATSGVADTFRIRAVANATGYVWKAPTGSIVTRVNDTTITVVFANTITIPDSIKVYTLSACDTSLVRGLALIKTIAAVPASILKSDGVTVAATDVCSNVGSSVTYKVRKVATAISYNWYMTRGTKATITHINPLGVNDTAIIINYQSGFTTDSINVSCSNGCGTSAVKLLKLSAVLLPPTPSTITANTGNFYPCPTNTVQYTVTSPAASTTQSSKAVYRWTRPANTTIIASNADSSVITIRYESNYAGGSLSVKCQTACGIQGTAKTQALAYIPPTPRGINASSGSYNVCIGSQVSFTCVDAAVCGCQTPITMHRWTRPNFTNITSATADSGTISLLIQTGFTGGSLTAKCQSPCGVLGAAKAQALTRSACPSGTKNSQTDTVNTDLFEVNIFPNPTRNSFNLKLNSTSREAISVKVLDLQGRQIKSMAVFTNQINNIGDDLKSGVYMFQITKGKEKRTVRGVKY